MNGFITERQKTLLSPFEACLGCDLRIKLQKATDSPLKERPQFI